MPVIAEQLNPLNALKEGVVRVNGRSAVPIPLKSTKIVAAIRSGFATISTTRLFRNDEDQTIEATLTFPVPVDCVTHDLRIDIDGRRLVAVAKAAEKARETYEDAVDTGKTAVLHEEKLKGVHMLSIAHIPPGKEVAVEVTWSKPLSYVGDVQTLRIPTTVAEIYGRSPLIAADELVVSDRLVFDASLSVTVDSGTVRLDGGDLRNGFAAVTLDRPIVLSVIDAAAKTLKGRSADGRAIEMAISRARQGEQALRAEILFDNSGSTNDCFPGEAETTSVWERARSALLRALKAIVQEGDRVALTEFNSRPNRIGEAAGAEIPGLVEFLHSPQGGTEIGLAIASVTSDWIKDIVLVTDGRTYALDVHALAASGRRISVVLCGPNSLEANVGHLAALTGGIIVVAGLDNIDSALRTVLSSLRAPASPAGRSELDIPPTNLVELRGGAEIRVAISGKPKKGMTPDAVGGYAAYLALPHLTKEAAAKAAEAHRLCTHLTSLVVVDDAGKAQDGLPNQRKVPLSMPIEKTIGRAVMASGAAPRFNAAAGDRMMRRSSADAGDHARQTRAPAPRDPSNIQSFVAAAASPKLLDLAHSIDWGAHLDQLSRGCIDHLDATMRQVIAAACTQPHVAALASALGMTTTHVIIVLMAERLGPSNRNAMRVARHGLKNADPALVEAARKALGL